MPISLNREFHRSPAEHLHIGLINNMPDAALEATERQFIRLIDEVAGGVVVHLSLYSVPGVPRSDASRRHIDAFYSGIEDLWNSRLDGLIVTGTEPRSANLMDEPYWDDLTRVLDWADRNTLSSVWSCLAAHAAVLHIDGIRRRRLSQKRSGVFECVRGSDHPLTHGLPQRLRMPHSRCNDLPESELTASGYRVLTRADRDVDMFVKQRRSQLVFFQGHPEYETDTLLREYRRDVRRYLNREIDAYPAMPHGYIDAETARVLGGFEERAVSGHSELLLADFPTALVESRLTNTWRSAATRIYTNWLGCLCERKERKAGRRPVRMVFERATMPLRALAAGVEGKARTTPGGAAGGILG